VEGLVEKAWVSDRGYGYNIKVIREEVSHDIKLDFQVNNITTFHISNRRLILFQDRAIQAT